MNRNFIENQIITLFHNPENILIKLRLGQLDNKELEQSIQLLKTYASV